MGPDASGRVDSRVDGLVDAIGEPLESIVDAAPVRFWTRGDTIRVVAALVVLVGTAVLSLRGVSHLEGEVFAFVNDAPDVLFWLAWPVMQLGNLWVASAIALAVGAALRRWHVALTLVAAPVLAWELARLVKAAVERGRPVAVELVVQQRGPAELGYGYISGHATVAFALAGAIAAHLHGRWKVGLFVAATLVALARIYVGVHLPLDVIGGAACGLLIGEAVRAIEIVKARRVASRARVRPPGAQPSR